MANTSYSVNTLTELQGINTTNFKDGTVIYVIAETNWYVFNKTINQWEQSRPEMFDTLVEQTNVQNNFLVNLQTSKQDKLTSGTNIKTINNQSLLGSGNIDIIGGGAGATITDGDKGDITVSGNGTIWTVDNLGNKQDLLVSGTNIKTINNQPILGSGNISISGGTGGGSLPLTGSEPPISVSPNYNGELYIDTVAKQFYLGSLSDSSWYKLTTVKFSGGTVLLMHFDGANNSTNFIDEKGKSIATAGTPVISTTQAKFGGSSGYFDGSSYLSIGNNSDFSFDSDFTIEFWCYFSSITNYMTLLDTGWQSGGLLIQTNAGTDSAGIWINGTQQGGFISLGALNQWSHVAIVRLQNSVSFFANGVKNTLSNYSATLNQLGLNIGKDITSNYFLNGYIDELRITKGLARYTANFTPPVAPFTN